MAKKVKYESLKFDDVLWTCKEGEFECDSSEDIGPLEEIVGQERAISSLDFGLGIDDGGYNIYVLGESGTGKVTIVKNLIQEKAKHEAVPDDWCYVYNFDKPDAPNAINLRSGVGSVLRNDMKELVKRLKVEIPKAYEAKEYEEHRDELYDKQSEETKDIFNKIEGLAIERGFMLKKTASGIVVVPAKNKKPMSSEEFESLSKERRKAYEKEMSFVQSKLSDALREARKIEKSTSEEIKNLDKEVVSFVVNPLIKEMSEKFKEFSQVVEYLKDVEEDVIVNHSDFLPEVETGITFALKPMAREPKFERYTINLIINNKDAKGAPVVWESNPTYRNLFGRIDYKVEYGVASTDFALIKAGSLHRAKGGYIIVNAKDILTNIFVYEGLKRLIKNQELKIEDVWEEYRQFSTSTLKPQAIAADIKIIIIGEPRLFYLLYNLDPEFKKFFKVKSDFESRIEKNKDTIKRYGSFIANVCKEKDLPPFLSSAMAKIVEYGVRLAEDKNYMTARFGEIEDLVKESTFYARKSGNGHVLAEHVEQAIEEKKYRHSRIEDKMRDAMEEDFILIDTEGESVGQVNGLAVLNMGDYAFGKPSRISASTYLGDKGVLSVEREVKMSGRIHDKAYMIVKGFLGQRYGQNFPVTLNANICFEQLYEGIEGDSATCAEIYALLSSIADVPLAQSIAVTGSMNQQGIVQPIGGVNEKVEGFYDVCEVKGLKDYQGVIIPKRNVRNLMLSKKVATAVKDGTFNIYAIDTIEEGLEILTGIEAGIMKEDGTYDKNTLNAKVYDNLKKMATSYKEFGKAKAHKKSSSSHDTSKGKK